MKLWSGVLLVFLLATNERSANAFKYSRASGRLTLELLVVADYSEFNKWYQLTSTSDSHMHRVNEAEQKLTEYVGTLIHSSNVVYKHLESHDIYIKIKLVDVLVMTTPSDSPWTETVKVASGSSYTLEPTKVLPLFQPKSEQLQRTIPHDHAMVFTKYALSYGGGSTFSGYAYTEAECKPKSVSVVEDNEDFYTAQLIAHEIGHSLGCEHDGAGNSCPIGAGYAMEANFKLANKNKWYFSSCSVTAIRNYLHDLSVNHNNCLQTVDNSHPDSQVTTATHEWYGQVYSWDQQCQMKYGPQSYLCRNQYGGSHGNYTRTCLKMFCYDTKKRGCYYLDGGDGSPCDSCVAGDQIGVVYSGRTCQQIGTSHPSDCSKSDVKTMCCHTCGSHKTFTSSTDIDGQCVNKHGAGSFMCRGATAYDDKPYADTVCSDLQCHDPNRANWCLSTKADDKTSCGKNKWCNNGICVHSSSAPAVPDNCPWGNQKGVATHGLTCDQLMQPQNHWRCYDDFTAKICCASCNSIQRNVQGCEYGDQSDWCQTNIASSADRQMCNWGHNSNLCCESCDKYKNAAHIGCEYGDKTYDCVSHKCNTYHSDMTQKCCETCRSVSIVG